MKSKKKMYISISIVDDKCKLYVVIKCWQLSSTIKIEIYIKKTYFTDDVQTPPKESLIKINKEYNRI